MHNGSAIKVVCFDLGGVVVRICRTWEEGCAAAGLPVRDPSRRAASKNARRGLIEQYQTGRINGPTFARLVSESLGGLYSSNEITAVHQAWIRGEYEGVGEIIERLHAADIATATLSNTNHEHWAQMIECPTVLSMRHLLASHLLGVHKPQPAIFRAVDSILGARGPQVLYFDDMPENIDAASSHGWHARLIDPMTETAPQIAAALKSHSVLK